MDELLEIPLVIEGHLPNWLSGCLIRNGPVYETIGQSQIAHWFDGLAMLHAFRFSGGDVTYTNRYLRSEAYKAVFEKRSLDYTGFATDPCRSLFKKFFTYFLTSDPIHNANINVAKIADHYVALTEIPLPVRFDPMTLQTLGVLNFNDSLPHSACWISAHPHEEEGGSLNYLIEFGKKSAYILYKINPYSTSRKVIGKIAVDKPSYMHSFAKTEKFIILAEYPFVVDPLELIKLEKPFIHNYAWDPTRGTRFLVINKQTGHKVFTFETASFFAFHHVNAYEEGEKIHLDIVCYQDPQIVLAIRNYFRVQKPYTDESLYPSELKRFTLDRKTGQCIFMTLMSEECEFPRINSCYDGKRYRYAYLCNPLDNHSGNGPRPLYKFDLEKMEKKIWQEKGCYPGEPVFIPAPHPTAEDDGVVLTVINDLEKKTSFLLALNGKTFQELGRVYAPQPIPPGLHGDYFH